MRIRWSTALPFALALVLVGPAPAESPRFETLDADGGFEAVRDADGVVLVDLYADW